MRSGALALGAALKANCTRQQPPDTVYTYLPYSRGEGKPHLTAHQAPPQYMAGAVNTADITVAQIYKGCFLHNVVLMAFNIRGRFCFFTMELI